MSALDVILFGVVVGIALVFITDKVSDAIERRRRRLWKAYAVAAAQWEHDRAAELGWTYDPVRDLYTDSSRNDGTTITRERHELPLFPGAQPNCARPLQRIDDPDWGAL